MWHQDFTQRCRTAD